MTVKHIIIIFLIISKTHLGVLPKEHEEKTDKKNVNCKTTGNEICNSISRTFLHFTKYGTDDREDRGITVGGSNDLVCCNLLLKVDEEEENGPITNSQALARKWPTRK